MTADPAFPPRAAGVILPSSNRVVERATEARLAGHPDVAACYARVPYGRMVAGAGYDATVFAAAADLLAEAGVAAMVWNATRGAALGFAPDETLCAALARRTGIPVATTALAARDRLRRDGLARIGLIVQGDEAEARLVAGRFAAEGIRTTAAVSLGIGENRLAAFVPRTRLLAAARDCTADGGVDAVLVWSTNLPGWTLPAALDGVPVLDAASLGTEAVLDLVRESGGSPGPER
ncbi:MAG: Asp/Glu/hydantoin racemase [Methylobacterium frigidaeris]